MSGVAGAGLAADKAALRARLLARRAALGPLELGTAARGLRDVLLTAPEVSGAGCVAAYVSIGREPGTGPLLEALAERAVRVLLPLLLPDGDLDWARDEGPDALAPAARGLLEPTGPALGVDAVRDADVVLVPGLAVDRRGGRIGRGGGSYDRVLHRLRVTSDAQHEAPWTCVLLHDGEVLDLPVPVEPHDVPVRAAATPSGLHRLAPTGG